MHIKDLFFFQVITGHRFQLNSTDELLAAFKTLDTQKEGKFSVEEMKRLFTQYGEPFAQDEIDEFLNAAVTPNTREINYKTFVHHLILDDEQKV